MKQGVKEKIFSTIISGGQTGVDRAALDVALELDREAGGWCPRGRRAEDGKISSRYPLQETASWKYPVRTRKNVQQSDGTLILTRGEPKGGTALTAALAEQLKKPYRVVDLEAEKEGTDVLRGWGRELAIQVLNVAGPRESEAPGIYEQATRFLKKLLAEN
ncbi:MAG: putative molybdenum carrier protein [Deltaproteobacteria bacterium]|nr:putative molybdenum carrier protein [Deltaproteobacteria bacterium]